MTGHRTDRSRWWWVAVTLTGLTALVTRFWDLGGRFMHHDEAVHAWFASELVSGRGYHADPVYHGPLLYHLEALVFRVAGLGDAQARVVSATAGVLLVALVVRLFCRVLGRGPAVLAAALAATSPTLVFYSRFNNHDLLVAMLSLVLLWVPLAWRRERDAVVATLGALALALGIATKLNIWFVVAAAGAWGVLRLRPWAAGSTRLGTTTSISTRGWSALAVAFVSVLAALYFTTFQHHLGETDSAILAFARTAAAPLVDPLRHWSSMHAQERLGGPFHFYGALLLVYEPLVLFGGLTFVVVTAWPRRQWLAWAAAMAAVSAAGLLLLDGHQQAWLRDVTHMNRAHVPLVVASAGLVFAAVRELLATGRGDEAYLLFVATMVSALYAYAGEKVPWLAVHVLVPWLLLVAWQLPRWWASARWVGRGALAASLLLSSAVSLWGTVALATFNRHNVGEPLLQVEFAGDVRLVVDVIRRRAAASPGDEVIAEIARDYQWPFHWYLRDVKVDYVDEASGSSGAPFVLAERAPPADFSHYTSQQGHYHTGSWWVTQAAALDLPGLARFWWVRDRWGPRWTTPFYVWRLDESREPPRAPDAP